MPLDGHEKIIERLKAGETLKAGFLGVQVEPAGKPAEGQFESGAVIKEIVPDSPAAKAGLEKGDKLISLGGAEIADQTHLISLVGRHLSGDKVEVVLKRDDETKTVEATLADAPPPMPMMPPMPIPAGEGKPPEKDKPADKPDQPKPPEKPAEKSDSPQPQ